MTPRDEYIRRSVETMLEPAREAVSPKLLRQLRDRLTRTLAHEIALSEQAARRAVENEIALTAAVAETTRHLETCDVCEDVSLTCHTYLAMTRRENGYLGRGVG